MVVGVLLFSGCLYRLALSPVSGLGHVVMIGGISYIAGWLALAWAARRFA
jgi:uncharacterized membrane protein YgdD (TMEM256/DUF423 family)